MKMQALIYIAAIALLAGCAHAQLDSPNQRIVAHSVQDSITARCDEKVWAVDVGMSRYYGGHLQVLEIINDDILLVIDY